MNARATGQPSRGGRRGTVFSVRVTSDERATLEALQQAGGPRRLGPWLVWRALGGEPPRSVGSTASRARPGAAVIPGPGSTSAAQSSGTTRPRPGSTSAAVIPGRRGTTCAGALVSSSGTTLPEACAIDAVPGTTRLGGERTGLVLPGQSEPPVAERVILDLCAGSGAWSAPYEQAGYPVVRVTLPGQDVRLFVPPPDVWGVLAAPPCNEFSMAKRTPRDLVAGMETVNACLSIILRARPRWWALENPTGHLSKFLGVPRDVFEPCDFGDPWTKRTALWGEFAIPRRGPHVHPVGSAMDRATAAERAITPPGFARAFFEANP